ncbi:uncharacterized protein LOC111234564 [Tachysurus ichikawai]
MFSVVWPQGCMMVENPTVTYGCTNGDIATTLANYVPASPSPLCQIEPCFINENAFMGPFHGIQFKHSLHM